MNTPEIINEIVEKIEKSFSKELKGPKIDDFLKEINIDLGYLVEESEEKHKQMISKEVEEFQKTIRENIDDRLSWTEVQDSLGKIKEGLNWLKGKIEQERLKSKKENEELERMAEKVKELTEKLNKWDELFKGKSPKEVTENLKNFATAMEEERRRYKENLDELQKKAENAKSITEVSVDIRKVANEYVNLGIEAGQKAGIGVLFSPVGGLIGAGLGWAHGATEATIYVAEGAGKGLERLADKSLDSGAKVTEKISHDVTDATKEITKQGATVTVAGIRAFSEAGKELGDFSKEAMKTFAGSVEDFRSGGEKLIAKSMDSGIDVLKEGRGAFGDVLKTIQTSVEAGVGVKVTEKELEAIKKWTDRLENELIKKEAELDWKQKQINSLLEQQAKSQETTGQMGLMALQLATNKG